MSEQVYYVYGFKPGVRKGLNSKPTFLASVYFEELADAQQQAAEIGYVGVWAQTKGKREGEYQSALGISSVPIGRMV